MNIDSSVICVIQLSTVRCAPLLETNQIQLRDEHHVFLLGAKLVVTLKGAPKPEACWSRRS